MELDDLLLISADLISTDGHVVEPPDIFENHLPQRDRSVARRIVTTTEGADVWEVNGHEVPNPAINAEAGLPPEEYGLEPTAYHRIRAGTDGIHASTSGSMT